MIVTHNLGFPRIGPNRELKWAVEAYWRGELNQSQLLATGQQLRREQWQTQSAAGLDLIPVGDFSWYDQVLDMSLLLGVIPTRFGNIEDHNALDTYFRMARGRAPSGADTTACEMTKWFDTNYHYLVPEFEPAQEFKLCSTKLFDEIREATALGHKIKPVLLGPLTYLWLGKGVSATFDKLNLLNKLLPVYGAILQQLKALGVEWVQIDEPILALDLPPAWQQAFEFSYSQLLVPGLKKLLTTYFDDLGDNTHLACRLPVDGLHIDLVRAPQQLQTVLDQLPAYKILSVGVIDGRNIWKSNLLPMLDQLKKIQGRIGERLWIAPSCSLLHCPVDLNNETELESEIKNWLAFAVQKLAELSLLKQALDTESLSLYQLLKDNTTAITSRTVSTRIHNPQVKERSGRVTADMSQRFSAYPQRAKIQQQILNLPLLPTTTIGSFPQTQAIRSARQLFKQGKLSQLDYEHTIKTHIHETVQKQLAIGIDVLVHGEAERNDMVEYFGEQLDGFAFTQQGWVQSYGSRCVKPPVLYGDVARSKPMTVEWTRYAQSLTDKPMKGMLTGPVTILQWSFVRDDQPRQDTCRQIALALRDEVVDLENAGINIIQIDEPALREGLPLRKTKWRDYLAWATESFRLCASGVKNQTQIHTHMCYAEFNDIIDSITQLDADVITIETSRSQMALLDAFKHYNYPNAIGPGTYDIHSPRIPSTEEMTALLTTAAKYIPVERLWVNPDCGLKTRHWPEVETALTNMINAAKQLRTTFAKTP